MLNESSRFATPLTLKYLGRSIARNDHFNRTLGATIFIGGTHVFGILQPSKLHGLAKENYKASFCGTCHALADVSLFSSLATSYDLTFLYHVLANLEGAPVTTRPCTVRRSRQLPVRLLKAPSQRWLAAVNFLLIEAKLKDDVLDDKKWLSRIGLVAFHRRLAWATKAVSETEFDPSCIKDLPNQQASIEAHSNPSLEKLGQPTSSMLGQVFAHLATLNGQPHTAPALRHLGQALGLAIYLKDAYDDYPYDVKRKRFNAILASGLPSREHPILLYALQRELTRSAHALKSLGFDLTAEGDPFHSILAGLYPQTAASSLSSPLLRWRLGQPLSASCDGCCDCSACDCSVCDCGGGGGGSCDCGDCIDCADCLDCFNCDDSTSWRNLCGNRTNISNSELAATAALTAGAAFAATSPQNSSALLCPACGDTMNVIDVSDIELDECPNCHGLWFDHHELEQVLDLQTMPPRLLQSRQAVNQDSLRPEGTRPCPRCAKRLRTTKIKGVQVDLCQHCKGLFLDQGELNRLLDA